MNDVQPDQLASYLRGRMGLIIGPDITKFPGSFSSLSVELAKKAEVPPAPRFIDTAESLVEKGLPRSEVFDSFRQIVGAQQTSATLSQLAKLRWPSVLSFSLDSHFDDSFRQERDRRASWQPITVLRTLTETLPPKTIPFLKLMGLPTDEGCAYSTTNYTVRRVLWRDAARLFRDHIKTNPVLCIGMGSAAWAFVDFIADMIAIKAIPSTMLLLADDPIANNTTIRSLLETRCVLLKVKGTINDVVRIAAEAEKFSYQPASLFDDHDDPLHYLRPYGDLVSLINEHLKSSLAVTEANRLRDLLFSPSVAKWDPFVFDLDFPRSCTTELLSQFNEYLAIPERQSAACILSGSSVTGKTTVLKRLAYDLAKEGSLVVWLKPTSFQDSPRVAIDLFHNISKVESHYGRKVVVIMDDPLSLGSLTPKDITSAAQLAGVQILLVATSRTSDLAIWDKREVVGGLPIHIQHNLPDDLDDTEWKRLPAYLVTLGIATDEKGARALITESRTTRDTLSTLYWLLPGTRVAIASALREEYHRLGDVAGLTNVIVGTYRQETGALKSAYEMVAVAAHYHASIPMEVLVSALAISFSDWLDITKDKSVLGGLLYEDDAIDGETVYYRPRNSIVTKLIVDTINGGVLGRTGELRVLSKLLAACTGATAVYREFCIRLLVPERKLHELECAEGLTLYETAIKALPYPDKTLVHHHGLWVKNKCNNPALAAKILMDALTTPIYPYAQKGEADGHIHTSLAATTLDGVDQGQITLEDGKRKIFEHLDKARELDFFDPKAVHVQANLVCRLADKVSAGASPDYLATVNRAVADVDHTLMMLQSQVVHHPAAVEDMQALEAIKQKVFVKVKDIEELKADAEKVWADFASQEGFVLAARKLYAIAMAKGKKFDVASSYCLHAMEKIAAAGAAISVGLRTVFVQITYQWKVHRRHMTEGTGEIPWDMLRDSCIPILSNSVRAPDPLFKHIYALSLAHLNKWVDANAIYHQLRQSNIPKHVLFVPRDYLLNPRGGIKTVQGTIKIGAKDKFLNCPEFETDFKVDKKDRWPGKDEEAFAAVQFSFAGPMAIEAPAKPT